MKLEAGCVVEVRCEGIQVARLRRDPATCKHIKEIQEMHEEDIVLVGLQRLVSPGSPDLPVFRAKFPLDFDSF